MNRVMRFRAWHKAEKRMFKVFRLSWFSGIFLIGDRDSEEGKRFGSGEVELMQFTGLHDKHGRDIYEGDILYHDDVRHWPKTVRKMTAEKLAKYPLEPIVVEWNEARAGFDPFVSEDDEQGPRFSPEKIEIVGNIYENQDLTHGKA